MKFSQSFKVSAADIDAQNHVNNVAYVRWIQDAAVAHWFSVTDEATRERLTWIVTRHEIDYKKPAFENEEITDHLGRRTDAHQLGKIHGNKTRRRFAGQSEKHMVFD